MRPPAVVIWQVLQVQHASLIPDGFTISGIYAECQGVLGTHKQAAYLGENVNFRRLANARAPSRLCAQWAHPVHQC